MKKRLRKKLHVGEFKAYGFEVTIHLNTTYTSDTFSDLVDRLYENGFEVGGGGNPIEFFVMRPGQRSADESDRSRLGDFLKTLPYVASFDIRELTNAWD